MRDMSMFSGETLQRLFEEGVLNRNPFLTLHEGVNEEDLHRYKLSKDIPKTSVFIDAKSSYNDIDLNITFDIVFALHSPFEYETVASQIKSAAIRPGVNLDKLPKGYSGICLIDFPFGKPLLLKRLRPANKQIDFKNYDTLYLTTQKVMDAILSRI